MTKWLLPRIALYAPAVFAICLSIFKLKSPTATSDAIYFLSVPLCFALMAMIQVPILKRIETLEKSREHR